MAHNPQHGAAPAEKHPRPRSVLIADDDRDSREALGFLLQLEGLTVYYAANGAEALQVADRIHPDVALLDISMPDHDGYDVCRRLRRSSAVKKIVALSALSGEAHRVRCDEAGFDAQFVKPLDFAQLDRLLHDSLH
jgi:two-component system OmpR family response regulator